MRRLLVSLALAVVALAGCGTGASKSGSPHPPAAVPRSSPAVSSSPGSPSSASPPAASGGMSSAPCGWKTATTYRHVVWLWLENRTYASVLGSGASAPHLSSYAARCGLATGYDAVTHPSLPNYLAAVSGSTGGVSSDCSPDTCPQSRQSLFGQLDGAGKSWRGYVEAMPGACALGSSGRYATKHNPAVYFTPLRSRCGSWDVPMGGSTGAFATALAQRSLPDFAFVTPDMCHDGHDCPTATADAWLGTWLGRITTSPAYRAGDTAVFLTWDEGVGSDQQVATVVIAPTVPRGLRVATRFTHYSLLRTTEELLGVGRLGAAADARSMRAAFHL